MEIVTGIRLKHIFLHNGNWWRFALKHTRMLRISIIINVIKMLLCKTDWLGHHIFKCPDCKHSIKVPHTCKSRFCSSCGKRATDDWIQNSYNAMPNTTYQHITFTLPDKFWDFFWLNRHLMNKLPKLAANIILSEARKRGYRPGIFVAIHTFGRDLKRNYHIHLSTTKGGLDLKQLKWFDKAYFKHNLLKPQWRYAIINLFRNEYKQGNLKLPKSLGHLKNYTEFNSWLNLYYKKQWVVHLQKPSNNLKRNVEYLGKYLKRPPLGETRIRDYDGENVTYEFLDHYTNTKETMTLPVLEFIARLVTHIPDSYFRQIRYYGFLANRVRGKLLHVVFRLLKLKAPKNKKFYTPWAKMIQQTFNFDPLTCPYCGNAMIFLHTVFRPKVNLLAMQRRFENEMAPLLI